MFKLFGKKKAVTQQKLRSDGYRECDFAIIQWFQATYEATQPEAVKAALYAARDHNFVITKQNLMRFVQQQEWAEAGGSYE